MIKPVLARNGALAGILHHPRAKAALGMNRPHRPRISQLRLKAHRPTSANPRQLQMCNRKLQRQFPGLAGLNRQVRALTFQALYLEVQKPV